MTTIDISPEAVARLRTSMRIGRSSMVDAERMIIALSAALTQSRAETAAAIEAAAQVLDTHGDSASSEALGQRLCCSGQMCGCRGADVGEFLQSLIRALTTPDQSSALADIEAAAEARGMRKAAEICPDVEPCDYDEYDLVGRFNQGFDAGIDYCRSRILAAIPQGEK